MNSYKYMIFLLFICLLSSKEALGSNLCTDQNISIVNANYSILDINRSVNNLITTLSDKEKNITKLKETIDTLELKLKLEQEKFEINKKVIENTLSSLEMFKYIIGIVVVLFGTVLTVLGFTSIKEVKSVKKEIEDSVDRKFIIIDQEIDLKYLKKDIEMTKKYETLSSELSNKIFDDIQSELNELDKLDKLSKLQKMTQEGSNVKRGSLSDSHEDNIF